jgi:hypothetical protein
MLRAIAVAVVLAGTIPPVQAGVVANYDILAQSHDRALRRESDRRDFATELDRHIQRLGDRYLAPGQELHLQFTRIDLAGEYEPWRTDWQDVRILRDVTPPRIHFRYTLLQGGQPVAKGEARLSDMNYLSDPRARGDTDRFIHEKLLLDDWFRRTFR